MFSVQHWIEMPPSDPRGLLLQHVKKRFTIQIQSLTIFLIITAYTLISFCILVLIILNL